ncbi:MAG: DUF4163 domain-containing protein [bacterium]
MKKKNRKTINKFDWAVLSILIAIFMWIAVYYCVSVDNNENSIKILYNNEVRDVAGEKTENDNGVLIGDNVFSKDSPDFMKIFGNNSKDLNDHIIVDNNLSRYSTEWQTALIREESLNASINIVYPEFKGEKFKNLNSYISDIILEKLAYDKEYIQNKINNEKEACNEDTTYYSHFCSVNLYVDYRVYLVTNNFVSLFLSITDFTGGGNGNRTNHVAINYDLKNDRLIEKDSIFCNENYFDEMEDLIRADLEKDIGEFSKDPVIKEIVEERSIVLLDYDTLIMTFPPYHPSPSPIWLFFPFEDISNSLCLPDCFKN